MTNVATGTRRDFALTSHCLRMRRPSSFVRSPIAQPGALVERTYFGFIGCEVRQTLTVLTIVTAERTFSRVGVLCADSEV